MKRYLLLLLIFALLLSGCGGAAHRMEDSAEVPAVPGVDPKSGAWIGQGGCWKLTEAEDAFPDNTQMSFVYKGERCCVTMLISGESELLLGERVLCRTPEMIACADAGEDGIWYAVEQRGEDGSFSVLLHCVNEDAVELGNLTLRFPQDCFPMRFFLFDGGFCYNCSDRIRLYSRDGSLLAEIPHEAWSGKLMKGSGGELYFVEEGNTGGGSLSRVDPQAGTLEPMLSYPLGTVCPGDGESPLLLICSDGVYHLWESGEREPLVIWEECGLALSGLLEVNAEADGSYLLRGSSFQPMRMIPAEPDELKPRTRLRLAVMGTGGALSREVAAFNTRSTDCCVELINLTEGGVSEADALTRLSTEIIAGNGPDMLAFGRGMLSPFPYIRKGLLRDLAQDVDADPEIDREELWTAKPIERDCGGLYLMAADFSMETRLGLRETFGDVCGWSFDDYLTLARNTPEDRVVMYNLTREYFLTEAASRFLRRAIDWQTGTCDFDNPDFIRLLEAARDMRETPEDQNNLVFGSNLMADGYMATELVYLNDVNSLARCMRQVGKPVSVIGFPTPDGSCGTDMELSPVGVLTTSKHPEACWAFLKDWLLHPSAIPAYEPLLREAILDAEREKPASEQQLFDQHLTPPLTEAEVQAFYRLLSDVEHTTLCDEAAMTIIREEAAAFLAGQRTAEETARLIQSRISLFVSEQK